MHKIIKIDFHFNFLAKTFNVATSVYLGITFRCVYIQLT